MKISTKTILIIFVILCSNEFFNLGPWWHVEGKFNIADVGNAVVFCGTLVMIFVKGVKVLWNKYTALVVIYLLLVTVQISLGSLYYNQDLLESIIGARHQYYYLSFILFFALLETSDDLRQLLNMLSIIAGISLVIGLINYFGPTIISHKWAEGHGVRSGYVRSYLPGMSIISAALFWEFSKLTTREHRAWISGSFTLVFLFAHFFRQTRMRIIGAILVIFGMLMVERRFKLLAISAMLGFCTIIYSKMILPSDIVLSVFETAYEDFSEGSGSWSGRVEQIKVDLKEFMKHPIMGSGTLSLRVNLGSVRTRQQVELWKLAYKADLGYSHWLKAYGIIGMFWLVAFFSFLIIDAINVWKIAEGWHSTIAVFMVSYTFFIVVTFITLNHMMFPHSIPLICLLTATTARIKLLVGHKNANLSGQIQYG